MCGDGVVAADNLCFKAALTLNSEGTATALVIAGWAPPGNALVFAIGGSLARADYDRTTGLSGPRIIAAITSAPMTDLDTGDLDSDGDIDLLGARGASNPQAFRGDGQGGVQSSFSVGSGEGTSVDVTVADFYGSEPGADFAAANTSGCGTVVQLKDLSGEGLVRSALQICSPTRVELAQTGPTTTSLASVRGKNLIVEPVIPSLAGSVTLGAATASLNLPADTLRIQAADLNGDNLEDLVVLTADDQIHVLLSNGSGGFTAQGGADFASYPTGAGAVDVAIGDLDGDGDRDIAVVNQGDNSLTLFVNDGTAGFTAETRAVTAGSSLSRLAVGDLDGDGVADIAVTAAGVILILPSDP